MVEINSDLITKIVKKVLAALDKESKKVKITAVFTGAKLGYEKSLTELKKIDSEYNVDWNFIFSDAAKEIHDHNRLKLDFGQKINRNNMVRADVKENDLLLIPLLSRNTAAKLAANFIDSQLLDYIFRALMCSIPTIAVSNAADLQGEDWGNMGFNKIPMQMLIDSEKSLAKLEKYGVKLIKAKNLSAKAFSLLKEKEQFQDSKNYLENNVNKDKIIPEKEDQEKLKEDFVAEKIVNLENKVITYKDINPLPELISKIYVRKDAIITPYAEEVAENKGMVICLQQK